MNRETARIHTGLYGQTAAKTLRLLVAGLRERIGWQEKDKKILGRNFTGEHTSVSVDATGEVVLDADKSVIDGRWSQYWQDRIEASAYRRKLDAAYVKEWFASALEAAARGYADRMDVVRLHPASESAQTSRAWEINATAAGLRGRDVAALFGEKIKEKVVGRMADPVRTEIAEVIAEETKRIRREYERLRHERHMDMLREIASVRARYKAVYADIGKQERAAVSKMKKEMLSV